MEIKVSKSHRIKEKTNIKVRVRLNQQVHPPTKQKKLANLTKLIKNLKTHPHPRAINPLLKANKIKLQRRMYIQAQDKQNPHKMINRIETLILMIYIIKIKGNKFYK